jgi:DNA replication protein DnaC
MELMKQHPFFYVEAIWNKEDHAKAIADFDDWHTKTCPVSFRASDSERLNPKFLAASNSWQIGPQGLGFFGPTGTTKTRCMWELIRRIAQPSPKIVRYSRGGGWWRIEVQYERPKICVVRDVEFARECAAQFKDGHDDKKLKRWRTCEVLCIDDLGKSRVTERVQTELFDLVDSRTSNHLPIIFTSNYNGKDMLDRFPSHREALPIVRRLAEYCRILKAT